MTLLDAEFVDVKIIALGCQRLLCHRVLLGVVEYRGILMNSEIAWQAGARILYLIAFSAENRCRSRIKCWAGFFRKML